MVPIALVATLLLGALGQAAALMYKVHNPLITSTWDTWVYVKDPNVDVGLARSYYLFYLAKNSDWFGFGLLVGDDGVHWQDLGMRVQLDPGEGWLGTGMVWPALSFSKDGKYVVNFSQYNAQTKGQAIFFAESVDLVHWTRVEKTFPIDSRYYQPAGAKDTRWDCIFAISADCSQRRPTAPYYGGWTAVPLGEPGNATARWGQGRSDDGVAWEALPAPTVEWSPNPYGNDVEIGALIWTGEYPQRHALAVLGQGYLLRNTEPCNVVNGTYRATPSDRNGNIFEGSAVYFPRFLFAGDDILVTVQYIQGGDDVYMSLFKLLVQDAAEPDVFRMYWWPQNKALHGAPLSLGSNVSSGLGYTFELPVAGSSPGHTGFCIDIGCFNVSYIPARSTGGSLIAIWSAPGAARIDHYAKVPAAPDVLQMLVYVRDRMVEVYMDELFIASAVLPSISSGALLPFPGSPAPQRVAGFQLTTSEEPPLGTRNAASAVFV